MLCSQPSYSWEGRDRCSEMMTAESKHLLLLLLVCLFLNTTSRDPGEWTRRHSNMDLFGLMLAFLTFFFFHLEARQACSPLLCHSLDYVIRSQKQEQASLVFLVCHRL